MAHSAWLFSYSKGYFKEHLQENFAVFDFELTETDMQLIDGLNKDMRFGPDPDNFNF